MSSKSILVAALLAGLLTGCGSDPAEHNKNLPVVKVKPGELKPEKGGQATRATPPQ